MFSLIIGGYIFAIPVVLMYLIIFYRTIMTFVDINVITDERLAQELRHILSFFAYSLFLIPFASIALGVALSSHFPSAEMVGAFTTILFGLSGLVVISILISFVIFLAVSVRIK